MPTLLSKYTVIYWCASSCSQRYKVTGSAKGSEDSLWLGCMKKTIICRGSQYPVYISVLVYVWERLFFSSQMPYREVISLGKPDKSSVSFTKKRERWHVEKERKEGCAKQEWSGMGGINTLSVSPYIKSYLAEHQDNCTYFSLCLSFSFSHFRSLFFQVLKKLIGLLN